MALSSSFAVYLHNLFHPTTWWVLFVIMLLASVAFAELLLFALLAACLTFVFHRLTPLHSLPPTHAVLLTGASSGLGEEVALRLAEMGVKVFAGVRKEADGYRLQVKAGQAEANILPLLLDVTNERHIAAAHTQIRTTCEQKGWRLYAIILNAGVGEYGPVEMISAARLRRQYEVNVVAPHVLTQTFLPLLRLSATPPRSLFLSLPSSVTPFKSSTPLQPRVLFMSSIASRVNVPGRGVYCSSKYALESLANAYRVELHGFGIRVVTICPGELYSKFHNNSKRLYAEVMRECTERAEQQLSPPTAQSAYSYSQSHTAASSSAPPPLPAAVLRQYDRAYTQCRKRWRVIGSADIAADAVEVALRTRWPLPRYDCGDDAAALPIVQLVPAKWLDFMLGHSFYTADRDDATQHDQDDDSADADAVDAAAALGSALGAESAESAESAAVAAGGAGSRRTVSDREERADVEGAARGTRARAADSHSG